MKDDDFKKLTETTREITEYYPETATFIGGMAVWHHCLYEGQEEFGAMTHDGDFVIGTYEFGDLKEMENLNRNLRLGKHEFHKNGFDFDVYVQHQTDLSVPVEEIISEGELINGSRVANLGHILKLKAVAAADRKDSTKGKKDQDDIIRILLCLRNKDIPANVERLDDDDCDIIKKAIKGEACVRLCRGNLHDAKMLRSTVQEVWSKIQRRNDPKGCDEV